MPSYLFLLKYTHEGPVIDSMLDITPAVGFKTMEDAIVVEKVRIKLGAPPNETLAHLMHAVSVIDLRSRYDGACDGPYTLHSEVELTRDQLEQVLQDKRILNRVRNKEKNETDTGSKGAAQRDRDEAAHVHMGRYRRR